MKTHLLIIEDDRWLADMYRDVLSSQYEVMIKHDAHAAIDVLGDASFDIILLDIMLPSGNGFAFLQELRSHNDLRDVPVIICSSVSFSITQQQALERFSPVSVLSKVDLTPNRLTGAVEEAVRASPK